MSHISLHTCKRADKKMPKLFSADARQFYEIEVYYIHSNGDGISAISSLTVARMAQQSPGEFNMWHLE